MGSLTGCMKKAGDYLSPATKTAVTRAFNAEVKARVPVNEAAVSAVQKVLADIDRQLKAAQAPAVVASAKRVDPNEMSTRVPYAKPRKGFTPQDAQANLLVADFASGQDQAKWLTAVNDLVTQYPNYRPAATANADAKRLDRLVKHMVENLVWLHDQVPAETRSRSKLWYDGANKIAGRMSSKYGIAQAQSSGILAVLSPQKDWFMNVSLADRVASIMAERQSFRWSPKMEQTAQRIFAGLQYQEDLDAVRGRSLEELDDDYSRAMWVRVYDQAHNSPSFDIVGPEGDALAVATTAAGVDSRVAWGSNPTIAKAISIFRNGSIENINEQLGRQHKVRNFYNNILVPNSPNGHVTIDTHAVAAALLRALSGNSVEVTHNFGGPASADAGLQGTYALYEEAYRRAAEARGILPREMQSITWEAIRGMYKPRFKGNANSVAAVDAVWDQYRKGKLSYERARDQVLELSGGIDQPSWLGRDPGAYEEDGPADDARGVPGDVVPGRAAAAMDGGAGVDAAGGVSEDLKASAKRQTETPEFKAWFGDSKVVDAEGKPLLMFHGTEADFSAFRHSRSDVGMHFGTAGQAADRLDYMREGGRRPEEGMRTLPVFLSIKNPLRLPDLGGWNRDTMDYKLRELFPADAPKIRALKTAKQIRDYLRVKGYDGIVYKNTGEVEGSGEFRARVAAARAAMSAVFPKNQSGFSVEDQKVPEYAAWSAAMKEYEAFREANGEDSYIAFDPEQIKSAIGNDGSFDANDPDITSSAKRNNAGRLVQSVWDMPDDSRATRVRYKLQDKHVDLKDAIASIQAAGRQLDEQQNAYDKETLYHGRTAKRTKEFIDGELAPLMESIRQNDLTLDKVEEFLWNRHAAERNEQVASIDGMPDGGSGILTADAQAYLAGLDPATRAKLEAVGRQVDAITKGTRDFLMASGLETQDTVNAWENAYKHYVPLNREEYEDIQGSGTGMGFSVRGAFSKRAMGSDKTVTNILANVARQRESAIVKAEKNRVAQAVFGMFVKHPNTDIALPVDPNLLVRDPVQSAQDLVKMGLSPVDAENIIREEKQRAIDKASGKIVERVNPSMRTRANVLALRVNGEDRYVFFKETDERAMRLVKTLKNLDAPRLNGLLQVLGVGTRWISSVNTQYNPVFGIFNYMRDFGGAMFNLTSTPLNGDQTKIAGDSLSALRGIYAEVRAARDGKKVNGAWSKLWEEFQQEGGQTGYRDLFATPADRQADLQQMFDPSSWTETGWGKYVSAGGRLKVPLELARKGGLPVFNWLSDYNESIENSIRLAAYKAAKDRGMTRQQAAVIAKNLTVNFNRKGEIATQAGALYGFFNAAVQGTDRLAQTLSGPAGRKIIAGGILLGVMQAMALATAGYDDDEVPEFQKDRSLIIPNPLDPKGYAAIPMPLGLHVLPSFGRRITEFAMRGFKDPSGAIFGLMGLLADAFNPIGGGGDVVASITPSVADPLISLARNKDWTGKPIAKEDRSSLDPTPGFTRSKDTATPWAKGLAEFLNWSTGGTEFTPGKFSPTPDQIDYLVGQVFGGVAREASKVSQVAQSAVTGEDLPMYKVPLVGRLIGKTNEAAAERGKYYNNLRLMNGHEREIKGRRESGQAGTIREYLADNPEARLIGAANEAEKDIRKMVARKKELVEREVPPEQVKMMEEAIARRMRRLNEMIKRAKEPQPVT